MTLLLLLLACGDEGTDLVIPDETLSGTVAGASWTFGAGEIDPYQSEGELFFAMLWPELYDPCELGGHEATSWLVLQIPAEVGEHPFTSTLNGTFVYEGQDGSENLPVLDGVVRVDEITDTELVGGLAMTDGSGDFDVAGTFTLTICTK